MTSSPVSRAAPRGEGDLVSTGGMYRGNGGAPAVAPCALAGLG